MRFNKTNKIDSFQGNLNSLVSSKPITSLNQPPNLTLSNTLTSNPTAQMPPNNMFSSSITKQQSQQTSNQLAPNSSFQSNLNMPPSSISGKNIRTKESNERVEILNGQFHI